MERVFAESLENKAWFEDESMVDENIDDDVIMNGRVYIEIEHLDHDILKMTVKCEGIETPVLGTAFHLEYQNNLLHFLRYDPGTFLEQGGDPFYIVSDNDGKVIFGETLRRDDNFPSGEGDIVSIFFQKDASYSDESVIEFKFKNGVVSGIDETRQDIDKINFEDFSSVKNEVVEVADLATETQASILTTNVSELDFQHYMLGVLSTFGVIFLVLASVILIKYIKASRKI